MCEVSQKNVSLSICWPVYLSDCLPTLSSFQNIIRFHQKDRKLGALQILFTTIWSHIQTLQKTSSKAQVLIFNNSMYLHFYSIIRPDEQFIIAQN